MKARKHAFQQGRIYDCNRSSAPDQENLPCDTGGVHIRLVWENPNVLAYQNNLATSYNNLGTWRLDNGDTAGAHKLSQQAVEIGEDLSRKHPDIPEYKKALAGTLGNLALTELFAHHPKEAIAAATRALELDPSQTWIKTNLAHGLLFDGQYAKALAIYTENKDVKLPNQGNQTFAAIVLDDFRQFRAKGITHPDMDKIEKRLRGAMIVPTLQRHGH